MLVDTHCHASDDPLAYSAGEGSTYADLAARVASTGIGQLVCMSTNARDQRIVAHLASQLEAKVVPCFGWHPWFVHQISLQHPAPNKEEHYRALFGETDELSEIWEQLAEPVSLQQVLSEIEDHFTQFPHAMLGEVGMDRAFRIPRRKWDYDPQSDQHKPHSGPKLTKLKTPQDHQMCVLRAQINLALRHRRSISLHSVQAAGLTVDLLSSLRNADPTLFGAIRVSIHSCSLDANVVQSISKLHPNVYFGFSATVNAKQIRLRTCLNSVHRTKALLESDYHTVDSIPQYLQQGVDYFADYYSLSRAKAAERLQKNWRAFSNTTSESDDEIDSDEDDDGPPVF